MEKELTVSDIEDKIQERMEHLELKGQVIRLDELKLFMGWLLCGDEY
jgi:hypothetical protein